MDVGIHASMEPQPHDYGARVGVERGDEVVRLVTARVQESVERNGNKWEMGIHASMEPQPHDDDARSGGKSGQANIR